MSTPMTCSDCQAQLPHGVRYCPQCSEAARSGRTAKCRGCQSPLEATYAFCPGCGERAEGDASRLGESSELPAHCSDCGAPMGPHFAHCARCGHARTDPHEECPGCERPVDAAWLYCGACGDRIEHLFHLQERGFSCGAAAVRNALVMLGIRQDEPYLRGVMGSRPFHGTTDEGFGKAAEAMGLEHAHIVEGSLESLRRELSAGNPCVLDWRHGAHYVCAVAATDTHVVFIDSNPRDADIARILTHARFLQLWWDDEDPARRHHAMHVFRRPVTRGVK
jgi:hypothetical protein